MSKLGGFLGLKSGAPSNEGETLPLHPPAQNDSSIDELFSPLAVRLGEENEAVRNLLVNAGSKMKELDAIRDSFRALVEPVSKTLRAYEEEKSEKAGLQAILNETRASYNKIRSDLSAVEKKAAALDDEARRLHGELTTAQQTLRQLEDAKAEQAVEIAARSSQVAELERRLAQELADGQTVREENQRFGERLTGTDKRLVQLEGEVEAARQKALIADQERTVLQTTLDQATAETSRLSRKIIEAENTLANAQARLRQAENSLAEIGAERSRLALALDEANDRHKGDLSGARARFDALQSRAVATEKLLEEARANLLAQAEQIRNFERRNTEIGIAHNALSSKVSEMNAALNERDAQIAELEKSRAALVERTTMLTRTVKARESALGRAEEQLTLLNDRLLRYEAEVAASRSAAERKIEELSAALQREKVERSVAEGALESGRKDLARLLREVATLKGKDAADEFAHRLTNAA